MFVAKRQQKTQSSFSQAEYEKEKKTTRRQVFSEKMEHVVPWSRLAEVIEPYYPKSGGRGRPPIGIERMLRMYCLQQWCGLADEAVEDAIYDSHARSSFMGIDRSHESVPGATTLIGFRHLLQANDLTKARGQDAIDSDIDLLVDSTRTTTLFDLGALQMALEVHRERAAHA